MKNQTQPEIKDPDKTQKGLPWWIFLLLAVISYYMLKYVPPMLLKNYPGLEAVFSLMQKAAPIAALGLLLVAANALYSDSPPVKDSENDDSTPTSNT